MDNLHAVPDDPMESRATYADTEDPDFSQRAWLRSYGTVSPDLLTGKKVPGELGPITRKLSNYAFRATPA